MMTHAAQAGNAARVNVNPRRVQGTLGAPSIDS
jgi:hypothetical protein